MSEDLSTSGLPEVPEVAAIKAGVWSSEVFVPPSSTPHLRYFRIFVPEDAVSVKFTVEQIQGVSPRADSCLPAVW